MKKVFSLRARVLLPSRFFVAKHHQYHQNVICDFTLTHSLTYSHTHTLTHSHTLTHIILYQDHHFLPMWPFKRKKNENDNKNNNKDDESEVSGALTSTEDGSAMMAVGDLLNLDHYSGAGAGGLNLYMDEMGDNVDFDDEV